MRLILISFGVFGIVSLSHLLLCRVAFFRKFRFPALAVLSLLGLANVMLVAAIQSTIVSSLTKDLWLQPLASTSVFLYALLMSSYFVFFANAGIESPTKRILDFTRKNKKVSAQELSSVVTDEHFVLERLKALEEFNLAKFESGVYRLTTRGLVIAGLLRWYGKLLDRKPGG